jgi:ribosomal protein L11 methylase PrmA
MAPELALRRLPRTHCGEEVSTVLDPMMGSGTIPVLASVDGHRAVGFDTDPLAVMIARTWGRPLDCTRYLESAERATEWEYSDMRTKKPKRSSTIGLTG